MLTGLAHFTIRRRRLVMVASLVVFLAAAAVGGGVAQHLSHGGFEDPQAEATKAADTLDEQFNSGPPNLLLLVEATGGAVDDPAVVEAGRALTAELAAEPTIEEAVSYWSLDNAPPLRSTDGTEALVLARIGGTQNEMIDHVEELSPRYNREDGPIKVRVSGLAEIFREVGETIESDLARAEMIALPITLLLLVLVFGSVVAASLPLAIGALAIMGTFLVLRTLAAMTEVSIYSLNLATAMGLALAIDYSLFIVSRYREELRRGLAPDEAVVRTMQTAGRTVVIAGATVAISLSVLLIFPLAFLRSFAYAGVAVVAFAVAGAIVTLPAILASLGTRVDKLSLWRRHPKEVGEGFWHRMAMTVMRRPIPIGTVVVIVLLLLGAPFLGVNFGLPDDRVLPEDAASRQVMDEIRSDFSSQEAGALSVVATGVDGVASRADDIGAYAARLSQLPGVARVDSAAGVYFGGQQVVPPAPQLAQRFTRPDATWLSVVPTVEPISDEGQDLVRAIRGAEAPFPVQVAGPSAELLDSKESLFSRVPWAGLAIGVITFVVLFLMFGSLLVPAKAVVLNLLSLTATFGAMVWVFQEGNLSGVLDFTATGMLDGTTPILMFCVAFGLSMDYEVFLLSRIKEEHDISGDNVASVAIGLERTGRIVTAAAAIMAVVFIAFAFSGITFIKLFGVGLAMAVLMDAFLIRATLVPAFMRLAGRANWWAPPFLRRVHDRFGISETPSAVLDVRRTDGDGNGARQVAEELERSGR